MESKKLFLRAFFVVEVFLFVLFYLFGAHGLRALRSHEEKNKQIQHEIQQLTSEIKQMREELAAWQSDSFYKEKYARERLQMARKNEEIYLMPKK